MSELVERMRSALADRYAIESEIGHGGMATVFLAEDLKHRRRVAIKVLHPDLAATVGGDRFLREIEIVAALDHPHVLTLLDSGEADGLLYYVMPYVEGESLRDRLVREQQLPIEVAIQIAREVGDGLGYAHRHGVVHRDIKPANIMLSEGHALIADFGVARAIGGDGQALTSTGLAVGTPAYMSPEQAGGGEPDARSDLYALGCVLYEMLAGLPPLTGPTPQATAAMRLTETATPLPVIRETVPEGMERVVNRALAKSPADRYGTAEKLVAALDDPELWAEARPGRRVWKPVGIVVSAITVLALGILAAQWFAGWGEASGLEVVPQRVAVLPFENRTGDAALDDLGALAAEEITTRLQLEDVGEVVPLPTVAAAIALAGSRDPVRAVAAATGAALVVTGSFSESGDSLAFAMRVTDSATGVQKGSLATSLLPSGMREAGLQEIGSRLAGGLLLAFDPNTHAAWVLTTYPTVEAYRLHQEASDLNRDGDFIESVSRYYAAADEDTTFWLPLFWAIGAFHNMGEFATADSLNRVIGERYRSRMSEVQRYFYDGSRAWFERDFETAYRMQRRLVSLLPSGWNVRQALSVTCFATNRPREVLETMQEAEDQLPQEPAIVGWHLTTKADAYHMLGDYEAELETSREIDRLGMRSPLGRKYALARALAALGDEDAVQTALDQMESLADSTARAGLMMLAVALELRYHGYPEASVPALHRAVRWFEARPGRVASDSLVYGATLYHAGELEAAERILERVLDASPMNVNVLGYMGLLAARSGDQNLASGYAARLERIGSDDYNSRAMTWAYRARIAAVSGDRVEAVSYLKRAFDEGLIYMPGEGLFLQYRFDFEAMSDYGPYRELLRPKG